MLASVLKNISEESKKILLIGLTASVGITFPIIVACITMVFLNSKEVTVKTDSLEFEMSGKGKELTAVDDISNQKLEQDFNELKEDFNSLKQKARKKKVLNVIYPEVTKVDHSVEKTEIRLHDAAESSEELNKFVELAIAEP